MNNIVERIKKCNKCTQKLKCVSWGRTLDRSSEDLNTKIDCMLVGQNPWFNNNKNKENVYAAAFGDKSEKILLKFFNQFKFDFSKIWITNVLKCSVEENNANKVFDAFDNCKEFFKEEIQMLQPKLIVTFGNVANSITTLFLRDEKIDIKKIKIFHPNALSYNPSLEEIFFDQIKSIYNTISNV